MMGGGAYCDCLLQIRHRKSLCVDLSLAVMIRVLVAFDCPLHCTCPGAEFFEYINLSKYSSTSLLCLFYMGTLQL